MEVKNYLVVGGTQGIGLATAMMLRNQGDNVFVWARKPNSILDEAGIAYISNDVTANNLNLESLPDTLHGLVYCPGSINLKPFHRLTEADFKHDMEVNLHGVVKTIQAVLPQLKKAGGASIVLFSTVAVSTGMGFHASIASAKGAVEGLTRSLAAEFAPGIRVNAIAPSLTDTPLAEKLLATEEKKEAARKRHPLQQYGNAYDIAAIASLLLSDNGKFMTGQILHADGGLSSVR